MEIVPPKRGLDQVVIEETGSPGDEKMPTAHATHVLVELGHDGVEVGAANLFGARRQIGSRLGSRLIHRTTSLRAKNASARPSAARHSIPRSVIIARKVSSRNHGRDLWLGNPSRMARTLRSATSPGRCTKAFGWPRSPSYLGISYSSIRWSRKALRVSSATVR